MPISPRKPPTRWPTASSPRRLTAEALAEHLAQRLAPYKRPARIHFREALPKSPIGKVLHRELRANL